MSDEIGWPFQAYSIQVIVYGNTTLTCYTTAQPFKVTPERALSMLEEFKSGIMAKVESFVVGGRVVTPITCYDREAGGEMFTKSAAYYPRERNQNNAIMKNAAVRSFYPRASEIILPPAILANNIISIHLIEELQHVSD